MNDKETPVKSCERKLDFLGQSIFQNITLASHPKKRFNHTKSEKLIHIFTCFHFIPFIIQK